VGRLIVNADDFGLTRGVNRAIAELHQMGALTSATLMAQGGAAEEAIAMTLQTPSLGVGCHMVLVDGKPVLSPRRDIPNLADPMSGCFRPSLLKFLRAAHRNGPWASVSPLDREIEAEAAAQIALLQARGLRLTHIDTHKHTHMFPAVLRPVLRAARAAGIRAVRNPFEPAWSRRATPHSSLLRRVEVSLLHRLEPAFRRIVAEEGFTTTDGCIGVLATGRLDDSTVSALLQNLPAGTWELVTHPGYNDSDLDQVCTRLRASREIERQALAAIQPQQGIEWVSFAQLAAEGTPRL
jgi:hopanoid biosynthesis associated protein HpnK